MKQQITPSSIIEEYRELDKDYYIYVRAYKVALHNQLQVRCSTATEFEKAVAFAPVRAISIQMKQAEKQMTKLRKLYRSLGYGNLSEQVTKEKELK